MNEHERENMLRREAAEAAEEALEEMLQAAGLEHAGVTSVSPSSGSQVEGLLLSAARHTFCGGCGRERPFVPEMVQGRFQDGRLIEIASYDRGCHGCGRWQDLATVPIPIEDLLDPQIRRDRLEAAVEELAAKVAELPSLGVAAVGWDDEVVWVGDALWDDMTAVPLPDGPVERPSTDEAEDWIDEYLIRSEAQDLLRTRAEAALKDAGFHPLTEIDGGDIELAWIIEVPANDHQAVS